MTNKIITASIAMILLLSVRAFTQTNAWNYLNFESGGYVTEIIPVKYPTGSQPPSINQQVLYARTDVGGIYRSTNNGETWEFVSNYYNTVPGGYEGITESELHIQGVAVRHDVTSNKQVVVVAWGYYIEDSQQQEFNSIWRSTDNGATWPTPKPTIHGSYGVWFQGNNFPVKIGGPCITYDPNNIDNINPPDFNTSWMYMGGFEKNNGRAYLYKSIDDGRNWNIVTSFKQIQDQSGADGEGIICISMKQGSGYIWVGTTHAVLYSTDNGASWKRKTINDANPHIKRIILKGNGTGTIAFYTWGYYYEGNPYTGIGKFEYNSSTTEWEYDPLNFGSLAGSLLSPLLFGDNEDVIFAGEYEGANTIKKSTDNGNSWNEVIQLKYLEGSYNNNFIPNHSIEYWNHPNPAHQNDNNIYDGMSCLTMNPNYGTGFDWRYQWYMSGGAGPRMTTGSGVQNNDLASANWKYTYTNQSMPVIYDVQFQDVVVNGNNKQVVLTPMSDWTMAWKYTGDLSSTQNGMIPEALEYDRHVTYRANLEDTYISNVIRIMQKPGDNNVSYCSGGSVYYYESEYRLAGFYIRTVEPDGSITEYRQDTDPLLQEDDRAMVDAVLVQNGSSNRIVSLVGVSSTQSPPTLPHTGIYYSDDEGLNWSPGNFDQPSGDASITTEEAYEGSLLPALLNGSVGGLFDGHFTLCHAGGDIVCLWLEDGEEANSGGIFVSTNDGQNWAKKLAPNELINGGYFGPGSMKSLGSNKIALAVRKGETNIAGIYTGTVSPTSGDITWDNGGYSLYEFISAEHVDYLNGKWAVYGKRTNDEYNQIYVSSNNGDTWKRIPKDGNSLPYFPKVHSLRIRPAPNDNELWVSTGGQGVYIYDQFGGYNCSQPPLIITESTTINSSMDLDQDIVVTNGATLTIQGPLNLKAVCQNKKLTVESGSSIFIDNVNIFGESGNKWEGIETINASSVQIKNSTFQDVRNPIGITNDGLIEMNSVVIENNEMILPINEPNTAGISIINSVNPPGGEKIFIVNNTITNGAYSLFLYSEAAEYTDYYIYGNTFNGTVMEQNIFCRKMTGDIKRNWFGYISNWDSDISLVIDQGNPSIYENGFWANEVNIISTVNSYPNLSPERNQGDQFVWTAGRNNFNTNAVDGTNILINSGDVITNYGHNNFHIANTTTAFHIYGTLEDYTCEYYSYGNCWYPGGIPHIYLESFGCNEVEVFHSGPIMSDCVEDVIPTGSIITDLGNGIYDTVITSYDSSSIPLQTDELLHTQAVLSMDVSYYINAISTFKNLIDNYTESDFLNTSLYDLYSCYENLDTIPEQASRDILYGSLKVYLVGKINSSNYSPEFEDIAYEITLMCDANMEEYDEALTGYEFIALFHPDPLARLLASWDYSAVEAMMGMGGSQTDKKDLVSIEKRYDKFINLMDDKPLLKKMKENYESISEIKNEKLEKEYERKYKDKSESDIKLRIRKQRNAELENKASLNLNRLSRLTRKERKSELIKDMIKITSVISGEGIKEDPIIPNVPTKYELSQNYPNPFNPVTKINYSIPKDGIVKIKVYDITGREITTLVNEYKMPGFYTVSFNGSKYASGVYFYKLEAGLFTGVKRMVLVK